MLPPPDVLQHLILRTNAAGGYRCRGRVMGLYDGYGIRPPITAAHSRDEITQTAWLRSSLLVDGELFRVAATVMEFSTSTRPSTQVIVNRVTSDATISSSK